MTGPELDRLARRVNDRIAGLLDRDRARWTKVDPDLEEPLASLRQLVMAGGKRLRPAFCYWAFIGSGGDPDDPQVIDAGAALEMLHTSALLHDDVMDGSTRRRGVEATHSDFGHRHTEAGWHGESRRFGEGVAILAGDLAFVYADMLLGEVPPEARSVWHQVRLEVNIGQYLDLLGTVRRQPSADLARRISQLKSGMYTIERPLHLGAALAAPSKLSRLAGPLSSYGRPLGEAFQLKDDLLGVFGDPQSTGKPVGGDLREGKPTLLYALARDRATGPDGRFLAARYGSVDLSDHDVAELRHLLESTGARREVESTIERLINEALAAVASLPLTEEACRGLVELAGFVGGRDR
jgi:geranylgeranyl diphosphate synthase, type I